ncbi:MAG TPA: hypothetical protein VJP87_07660 [Candidatus Acidoferrales bacterium]|nr:hypothetical protein [Candidatus Acidoferrales bacterium]
MKTKLAFLPALLLAAAPVLAQRPDEHPPQQHPSQQHTQPQHPATEHPAPHHEANPPRANQGHIPPPPTRREMQAAPEAEHHDGGRMNNMPHVNNNHWYGHDQPNDHRYHVDHPYEHGRFDHFGPDYRYRIQRFDRDRHLFWLPSGAYFQIAPWDWAIASDWCWDCDADDFVIYEDPDHPGWYLLYNVDTGQYVHVTFMGG